MRGLFLLGLLFVAVFYPVETLSARPDAMDKSPAAPMVKNQVTQDNPPPPSDRVLLPVSSTVGLATWMTW